MQRESVADALAAARQAASSVQSARATVRTRRRRRVVRIGLVVAAVWVGAAVACLALGAREALEGRQVLDGVRDEATAATLLAGDDVPRLVEARDRFAAAHGWMGNPVVTPLTWLPVVGRQVRSARALAGAAEQVSSTAALVLDEAGSLLVGGLPTGAARTDLLREVSRLAAGAEADLAAIDLGPSSHLLGPLAEARSAAAEELDELTSTSSRAATAAAGLADLLGSGSSYVLLVANNAEMRAASGMFLSAGRLDFADGSLTVGELSQSADLRQEVGVPLEDDLESLWGWLEPGREWRNLALTPRFDVTAPLATRMWEEATGETVRGALVVDVLALRALLAATGPVTVGDVTLDAESVVDYLLYDQYVGYDPSDDADDLARRSRLGEVASEVVSALDQGEVDVATLAEELAAAAEGRHLLAWDADAEMRAAWEAAGIGGALTEESLALSVLNRSGSKLDQFLEVDAAIEAAEVDGGTEVIVTARLRNAARSDAPAYVLGPDPSVPVEPGTYVGLVSLTMPGSTEGAQVSGIDELVARGPDGPTSVLAGSVAIPLGEEATVTFRFTLPPGHEVVEVLADARATSIRWRAGTLSWAGDHPVRLEF